MFHSVGHRIKTGKPSIGSGIDRMRIAVPFLSLLIASTLCAVSGTGNAAVPDATGGRNRRLPSQGAEGRRRSIRQG